MRLLLMLLACLMVHNARARDVEVTRLDVSAASIDLVAVRASSDAQWVESDAIRKQPQPSWWQLRLEPGDDEAEVWIVAIKEAYDAELVGYLPPDYLAQRLHAFDPQREQIGSRHRLTLELPVDVASMPIFVQMIEGRNQPMRVTAAPLRAYVAEDLNRVRVTSMVLSALLLLSVVAVIYAMALRRWFLLLFALWVASSAIYVLVMSGDVVWLVDDPDLARHAMRVSGVTLNLGLIALYLFVIGFLDMPRHFPRLTRAMHVLLGVTGLLIILTLIDPRIAIGNQVLNLAVMALALISLVAAVARARAGSQEGWFFLLGWGTLTLVAMARAGFFLQHQGTPDWLEIAHPTAQVFGALVLVLATARAARFAEREMHVARRVARTDALTRLPNRVDFDQGLAELVRAAERDGQPLCLLFLDIDHFKAINDRHGHAVGDRCLAAVGNTLRRHVRACDLVARYGGEEFVLVLENVGNERAAAAAEELRLAVQTDARVVDGVSVGLTASIGVTAHRAGDTVEDLLERADAALYRAKREGRNRMVTDFPP